MTRRLRRREKEERIIPSNTQISGQVKEKKDFLDRNYKHFMIFPIILLLICLGSLGYTKITTGEFIAMGYDFTGGSEITVPTTQNIDIPQVNADLEKFGEVSVRVEKSLGGSQNSLTVEAGVNVDTDALKKELATKFNVPESDISVNTISSKLGKNFLMIAETALVFAFLFMAIVVFLCFKTFVPSFAVILAGFSDIVETVAVMSILDITLSLPAFAALLMLIGYSVDTDILLTTKMIREKEIGIFERVKSAMKTGITMQIATVLALTVMFFISTSRVLDTIAIILIIGVIFDVINTWVQNVGILRWYIEKKEIEK